VAEGESNEFSISPLIWNDFYPKPRLLDLGPPELRRPSDTALLARRESRLRLRPACGHPDAGREFHKTSCRRLNLPKRADPGVPEERVG
jgi:hypothetical protein